ncbi:MAG: response regulator [Pseudomonadota bacterium]
MNEFDHSNPNRILLVDDEEDIRDVLGISLMDMGYEVITAENGIAALDLFEKQPFPIVLTDIKMPGMDGITLLKNIKRRFPSTEIIMITGHGDMDLAIESFRSEAVEFITKPVDVRTLEIAINRAKEKIEIKKKLSDYTTTLERMVYEKTEALKKAGTEARDSKMSLAALTDNLPLVMFMVNRDLFITASNSLFKQQFGGKTGEHCYSLCRQRALPCDNCPALKTFETAQSVQVETVYSTRDQEDITYFAWSSPIIDASNVVTEVMIMATDVSRIIDIQDHLASLGLMVGSVSHGIKGLLTGLDGGVYVLDSALKKQDQDLAKEGLEMVRQTVSRIRKMILDILFYAKERELKKEIVSAQGFIRDLVKVASTKASSHGIELKTHWPTQDIEFPADSGVLHAALVNIIDNAIDACVDDTAKSGHIILIDVRHVDGQLTFSISDNGIGMDASELENAFTLFHSGKGKKGTGLGLFIAEKSIRQHNGTIRAESQKGKGTQFTITLPAD